METVNSLDTFDTGFESLPEIGSVVVKESTSYGQYKMRCVAHLDWFPTTITVDEAIKIFDKFHPTKWAVSLILQPNNPACRHNRYCAVFIAVDEDNLDWYAKNNGTDASYFEHIKTTKSRVRKLPIGMSVKQLEKNLAGLGPVVLSRATFDTVEK